MKKATTKMSSTTRKSANRSNSHPRFVIDDTVRAQLSTTVRQVSCDQIGQRCSEGCRPFAFPPSSCSAWELDVQRHEDTSTSFITRRRLNAGQHCSLAASSAGVATFDHTGQGKCDSHHSTLVNWFVACRPTALARDYRDWILAAHHTTRPFLNRFPHHYLRARRTRRESQGRR
jgi:hypothetical protein